MPNKLSERFNKYPSYKRTKDHYRNCNRPTYCNACDTWDYYGNLIRNLFYIFVNNVWIYKLGSLVVSFAGLQCPINCVITESDLASWYRWYRSMVYLSVCCSVCNVHALCSNGRRYRHNFLLYTTVPCLSQILLKFGLHRSANSSLSFIPKWPTPCWFERRRYSISNCGRMVRYSAMVTMERL